MGPDTLVLGPGGPGIERLRARLSGRPFVPHRHATYAIGLTTSGVQSFRYRGREWHGLPGQCHVLHPDELHDGRAGDGGVFAYRMLYIDPALIQQATGASSLPYVADAVQHAEPPDDLTAQWLWDPDPDLDGDALAAVDTACAVADWLWARARPGHAAPRRSLGPLAMNALRRVREHLIDEPCDALDAGQLERLAGLDRWALARQFRAAYGTSPSRFRRHGQMTLARQRLLAGASLADAALAAGFADQSHFTRQFKRLHGAPPGRWLAWVRQGRAAAAP